MSARFLALHFAVAISLGAKAGCHEPGHIEHFDENILLDAATALNC